MQTNEKELLQRIESLERRIGTERRRLRVLSGLALCVVVAAILISPAGRRAGAQSGLPFEAINARLSALEGSMASLRAGLTQVTQDVAGLKTRVSDAEDAIETLNAKTQYVSVDGGEMYITGTNLHIVNGLGATNGNPARRYSIDPSDIIVNGKGNLIIGYNETRALSNWNDWWKLPDDRTGSHNLILGLCQAYGAHSGILNGRCNTQPPGSRDCSVIGGAFNTAGGVTNTIVGGDWNSTWGWSDVVAGGIGNGSGSGFSSVFGGNGNTASAALSTITGGQNIDVSTDYGWAAGGLSPAARQLGAYHAP